MSDVDIHFFDETHFRLRIKNFSKKHQEEVAQTLNNFDKAMNFFRFANTNQLRADNLVRPESRGVLAVDQTGSRTRPPYVLRLYFYPWEDRAGKHVMVLTMGDKRQQQEDNNYCVECLKRAGLK